MSNDNIKDSVKRLEDLKQATLVNYLSIIDLDNDIDLYDKMIHLFVEGNLDEAFYSPEIEEMDDLDRKKLQELVRKYISLCFFSGNPSYWTDSIEGVSLMNLDLICMRIFDNYNFLLKLANMGGEDALKQLSAFQKMESFSEKVLVDYLRNSFHDDTLLQSLLIDFSKQDEFRGLTDKQKAIMFMFPDGVLIDKDNNSIKMIDVDTLKQKIKKYSSSSKDFSSMTLKEIIDYLGEDTYNNIISEIYLDSVIDFNEINPTNSLTK